MNPFGTRVGPCGPAPCDGGDSGVGGVGGGGSSCSGGGDGDGLVQDNVEVSPPLRDGVGRRDVWVPPPPLVAHEMDDGSHRVRSGRSPILILSKEKSVCLFLAVSCLSGS